MKFEGTIIAESLAEKSVLDRVRIAATRIESVTDKHMTPWLKRWTLHDVEIPAEEAAEIAEELSKALDAERNNWYADYKTDVEHYIIYRDRIFHITDRSDKKQYDEATEYGISIGVPAHQVDFSPLVTRWER